MSVGAFTTEISVKDLKEGMHVVDLDRPWHETPFPIQGFYVRSQDEVSALSFYCKTVHIETGEGREDEEDSETSSHRPESDNKGKLLKVPEIVIKKSHQYPAIIPIKQEIREASSLVDDVSQSMSTILRDVRRGHSVDIGAVGNCAEAMTESVIRNPSALLFLSRIKNRDAHTYNHSLKTAIWAIIIARDYGLGPESVKNIGKSALLSKIGRVAIMDELGKKEQRSPREDAEAYRQYPVLGAEMLKKANLHSIVRETVQSHRERHNGSGFPYGLTGDKIPLSAKIVGIADYYEFLVEHRTGHSGMSPSRAAAHLYNARDELFQGDLVDRLIATVGVYPVGSNVVLSDGRTGVITELHPEHRLSPTLQIIKDEQGNDVDAGAFVNLAEVNRAAQTPITIQRCLPFHSVPCAAEQTYLMEEVVSPPDKERAQSRLVGWAAYLANRIASSLRMTR